LKKTSESEIACSSVTFYLKKFIILRGTNCRMISGKKAAKLNENEIM
jgi:hypothetical protein